MQDIKVVTASKYENFLLLFVLVDIFFAPYVFFIATTFSQLFVFIWFIKKNKSVFHQNELSFYYLIGVFVVVSVFVSLFTIPTLFAEEYLVENIKRGLAFYMAISYYFFFSYMVKRKKFAFEKWIYALVIYISLWGLLYFINMNTFLAIKPFFNRADPFTNGAMVSDPDYFNRFNFIWSDPNNIGYTIVGLAAFLIVHRRTSNVIVVTAVLATLFVVFITMSGGSIISAAVVLPLALFMRFKTSASIKSFLVILISIITISGITISYSDQILGSEIGETTVARLEDKTETEEPRLEIWNRLFENKNVLYYLPAGEGIMIFLKGRPFSPHNGHFMLIFGFGVLCYLLYMYLFYRKSRAQQWSDFLFIFPFLLCFTLNIGIGELKYAAIFYILVAYSRNRNIKLVLVTRNDVVSNKDS